MHVEVQIFHQSCLLALTCLGRVLEQGDKPSNVLQQSPHRSPIQFVVGVAHTTPKPPASVQKPANKLIRVHHQLQGGGVQSFTSLIVSPAMNAKEMLELAVSKAVPFESATGFCLVLVTPKGGRQYS